MTKDELFIEQLRQIFPTRRIDECLDFDDQKLFYICEKAVTNQSYIEREKENCGLEIKNPKQKVIYLLAIDNCFFVNGDGYTNKRCDCIVFDNHYLCFVELKVDVKKFKQTTRELRSAREQIGNVILFFRQAFQKTAQDLLGFELEAYIVMRQNVYPRHPARLGPIKVRFFDKYGVKLYERNSKEF